MCSFGRLGDDSVATRLRRASWDYNLPRKLPLPGASSASPAVLLVTMLLVGTSGCRFGGGDTVGVGYYGATQSGGAGTPSAMTGKPSGGAQGSGTPVAGRATSSPPTTAGSAPSGVAAASGALGASTAGSPGAVADQMPSDVGAAGSGAGVAGGGLAGNVAAGAPVTGAAGSGVTGPCDLSGRWLSTLHYTSEALGQQQATLSYLYYEIAQQGDSFTITKGLQCGDDSLGLGSFGTTVDTRASWPAIVSKAGYTGRTGTSVATSAGCQVDFQKWYVVRGATVPYYTDPAKPLPTAEQKATDTEPGWEDWDADGNPGITGAITGVVSGKIFMAPRFWTTISASAPDVSSTFQVPLDWNVEQNVMSYDGTPLLASDAVRATDPSLHFAMFARLTPEQVMGDDQAVCKSVVALAPTLTPSPMGM